MHWSGVTWRPCLTRPSLCADPIGPVCKPGLWKTLEDLASDLKSIRCQSPSPMIVPPPGPVRHFRVTADKSRIPTLPPSEVTGYLSLTPNRGGRTRGPSHQDSDAPMLPALESKCCQKCTMKNMSRFYIKSNLTLTSPTLAPILSRCPNVPR